MCDMSRMYAESNQSSILDMIINNLKKINKAQFETLGIVLNHDQFEAILGSLNEIREGKVVSLKDAFSDLD